MISAKTAALYLCELERDTYPSRQDRELRVNLYLHLLQVFHIAKHGEKLFPEDLYAGGNCGVVPEVWRHGENLRYEWSVGDWQRELREHEAEKAFLDWFFGLYGPSDIALLLSYAQKDPAYTEALAREDKAMDNVGKIGYYREAMQIVLNLIP